MKALYTILILITCIDLTAQIHLKDKYNTKSSQNLPKCNNKANPYSVDYNKEFLICPKKKDYVKIKYIKIQKDNNQEIIEDPEIFQGNIGDTLIFSIKKLMEISRASNFIRDKTKYKLTIKILSKKDSCITYFNYTHNDSLRSLNIFYRKTKIATNKPKDFAEDIDNKDTLLIESNDGNKIEIKIRICSMVNTNIIKEVKIDQLSLGSQYKISLNYLYRIKKINANDILSGDYIEFEITTEKEVADINFRYSNFGKVVFGDFKFYAPVLLRIDGCFKDFGLTDLAPSLGYGVYKFEFQNEIIRHVGINLLVTVLQVKSDSANAQKNRYSLGVGAYCDIGGWISLGMIHQFKDKKTYLVLGFRIEEIRRLFNQK